VELTSSYSHLYRFNWRRNYSRQAEGEVERNEEYTSAGRTRLDKRELTISAEMVGRDMGPKRQGSVVIYGNGVGFSKQTPSSRPTCVRLYVRLGEYGSCLALLVGGTWKWQPCRPNRADAASVMHSALLW